MTKHLSFSREIITFADKSIITTKYNTKKGEAPYYNTK